MGIASSGSEMGKPQVADNELIATVVINDMLLRLTGEEQPFTLVQLRLNQKLIADFTKPGKRYSFMSQVLDGYVEPDNSEAPPITLFHAAGLTEYYTPDGVAEEMIKICREFNKLGNKDQWQWLAEIKNGTRLSSASFAPKTDS